MCHRTPLHTGMPSILWEVLKLACIIIISELVSLLPLAELPETRWVLVYPSLRPYQTSPVSSFRGLRAPGTGHALMGCEKEGMRWGQAPSPGWYLSPIKSFVWSSKEGKLAHQRRSWPKFRYGFEVIFVGLRLQNNSYAELTPKSSENFGVKVFQMKRHGV